MYSNHFAKRTILLDCIRFVAITMVLVYHATVYFDAAELDLIAYWFHKYGFYGVDLFFPLSGFLITRFLLHTQRPDYVRAFFLRRIFRILPLYLGAVTVYVVASMLTGFDEEIIDRVWIVYLFLTGWFVFQDGVATVPYTVTWSLSVEEFAYILFGLFAWIRRKDFKVFLVIMIVGPMLLRIPLYLQDFSHVYYFPPARLDSIAIGGLTALLLQRQQKHLLFLLSSAAIALWVLSSFGTLWAQVLFVSALACAVCALIVLIETRLPQSNGRALQAPALIGFYSYFIYLIHPFAIYGVLQVLKRLDMDMLWLVTGLAYALTYGAAVLSYKYFEGPLIDFGRRLERQADTSS